MSGHRRPGPRGATTRSCARCALRARRASWPTRSGTSRRSAPPRTSRGNVSPLRRGVRRLGAGGTTVVAVVALSSGVAAAAYTRHLPDPVQRVVHDVLGAPAPGPRRRPTPQADPPPPSPTDVAGSTDAGSPPPHPRRRPTHGAPTQTRAGPTSGPTSGTHAPRRPRHRRRSAPPTADPDGRARPRHPPPPSPRRHPPHRYRRPSPCPGTSHRATPGSSMTLSGHASPRPTARRSPAHDVVLQRRGPHRWLRVAVATADDSGAVSFTTPPADATARYRLVGAPGVRSDVWRVVLVPRVTADSSGRRSGRRRDATVQGARPGDRVVAAPAGPPPAAGGRPDDGRAATARPPGASTPARTTTYVVRLPATRPTPARRPAHRDPAAARASIIGADTHETGPGGSRDDPRRRPRRGRRAAARPRGRAPGRGPQRWRPVATATSDAFGAVAISDPGGRADRGLPPARRTGDQQSLAGGAGADAPGHGDRRRPGTDHRRSPPSARRRATRSPCCAGSTAPWSRCCRRPWTPAARRASRSPRASRRRGTSPGCRPPRPRPGPGPRRHPASSPFAYAA